MDLLRLKALLVHLVLYCNITEAELIVGIDVGGISVGIGGGTESPATLPKATMEEAYSALQAWKLAITDDPFRVMDTWVGSGVCGYKGVSCSDPENDVVLGIDLNRASLQGTLVNELSLLKDITLLHLNSNRFSGSIPGGFSNLVSLEELDLSNNQFSGAFPAVALRIPNLIYLDLRFNNFSGRIPPELFVKRLDAIFLNNNNFEGEIPNTIWNSPASVINLANNRFTGSISTGAHGNSGLKEILLLNNRLTGCLPEELGFLSRMEVLDVSSNLLTGHLPRSLSCLSEMQVLNVAHNKLSGVVPDVLCSIRSLLNLTVAFNFFSGFSHECESLFVGGPGFDFSSNCVPGGRKQRSAPDCLDTDGWGCVRNPSQSLVCP